MFPPIAILGAGPAGLTLARLLSLAGTDFVVFERDASASAAWGRGGSGTLDLHEGSGLLALEEAGLLEEFKKKARYDVPLTIADKHGQVRMRHGDGEDTTRPEIDRRDLRMLLLNAVPSDKIRWGAKVASVQKQPSTGTVTIRFENGNSESGFRLVVGADGARSKCRSLVRPSSSSPPRASPKRNSLTDPKAHHHPPHLRWPLLHNNNHPPPTSPSHPLAIALAGTGNYMSMGSARLIAAMRLSDGSYYTFAGLSLPESWKDDNADPLRNDPAALKRELIATHFADWPTATTDLITQSSSEVYVWPLYGVPAERVGWEHVAGVTLVGDAAHLCPPGGDGVNVAMHDSLQLAQQLAAFGLDDEGLDAAVGAYERLMFPRAKAMIEDSAVMNEAMFAEDAPGPLSRLFEGLLAGGEEEKK